jgi:hypothetical protein
MDQATKPLKMIEIRDIIQSGTKRSIKYQIPFYLAKQQDVEVEIRALSNYEYSIIDVEMYRGIDNKKVLDYILNEDEEEVDETELSGVYKPEQVTSEKIDGKEIITVMPLEPIIEKEEKEEDIKVDNIEVIKAYLFRDVLIVYYAMKDFIDLTVEQVKEIGGINDIARKVDELSGRTSSVQEGVEFFRDTPDELGSTVSDS